MTQSSPVPPSTHSALPGSVMIERFGGIRPMATKLAVPVTTVQGWKKRDAIPLNRKDQILAAARTHGIDVADLLTGIPSSGMSPSSPEPSESSAFVPDASPVRGSAVAAGLEPLPVDPLPEPAPSVCPVSSAPIPLRSNRAGRAANATWIGVMILSGAVVVGLLAMGPGVQRIVSQDQRLASLETELAQVDHQMQSVQSQNALLKGLVPDDLQTQLRALRDRAVSIEETVTSLTAQAKSVGSAVLSANGGTVPQRIAVLEGQVKAFAQQTGSPGLGAFFGRLQALRADGGGHDTIEQAVTQLYESLLAPGTPPADDLQLSAGLAAAAQEDGAFKQAVGDLSGQDLKAAAMLLTLTQLRSTLARDGASFDHDLSLMRELVAKDNPDLQAAIDRLAPRAKEGVLTPQGLNHEFRSLAGDIVSASLAGENVSLSEKAQARLHDLLKVEKDGQLLTGTATQKSIAQAQVLLDRGDVQGAVTVLQGLDGRAAQVAAPWVSDAEGTILAQQVQDMLTKTVSAKLSLQPIARQLSGLSSAGLDLKALTSGVVESLGGSYVHDPSSGFRMAVPPPKLEIPTLPKAKTYQP